MADKKPEFKERSYWQKVLLVWTHDGADHFSNWLDGWEIEPLWVALGIFLLEVFIGLTYDPDAVAGTLAMIIAISPVWLPIYLFNFFWTSWIRYIRYLFWFDQKHVLLRVELPAEVTRSPLAMELFLTAMYQTGGEGDFIARIWAGKFRPHFSLEIASNEGRVDFYLYTREGFKNILEAKLYGQFPEARVTQVEDYVDAVPFTPETHGMWGSEFQKGDKALPIRTYIDYQLDKSPDEPETQVEPLGNVLEHMGAIGPGEYMWLQFIIRARKEDEWYGFYTGDSQKEAVKEKINEILEGAAKRAHEQTTDEKKELKLSPQNLTRGEGAKIEAIERGQSKSLFEVGIRGFYMAKKENFKGNNIGNFITIFSPFRYPGYASLGVARGQALFTYPWQKLWGLLDYREDQVKRQLFFYYKHRAYFNVPYDQVPSFMTTEELATLWHFPSSALKTPALSRVPSRRAEAPPGLPTGDFQLPQ